MSERGKRAARAVACRPALSHAPPATLALLSLSPHRVAHLFHDLTRRARLLVGGCGGRGCGGPGRGAHALPLAGALCERERKERKAVSEVRGAPGCAVALRLWVCMPAHAQTRMRHCVRPGRGRPPALLGPRGKGAPEKKRASGKQEKGKNAPPSRSAHPSRPAAAGTPPPPWARPWWNRP